MTHKLAAPLTNTNFGLVCLTSDRSISFKTITKKKFETLTEDKKASELQRIYSTNIQMLEKAILLCQSLGIKLYRASSAMFSFGDTELGRSVLFDLAEEFERVGTIIKQSGIRVIAHPDQFVVLSSPEAHIVENSTRILEHHADVFDLLGLEQSRWNLLNIHGGGKYSPERFQALVENVNKLSPRVKNRLTFENCEYGWSAEQLFEVYQQTGVPVLFDSHHALIHKHREVFPKLKKSETYSDAQVSAQDELLSLGYNHPHLESQFQLSRSSWTKPEQQVCHISNGKEEQFDRKHHDYISVMPNHLNQCQWVEVEAKAKELAVLQLMRG